MIVSLKDMTKGQKGTVTSIEVTGLSHMRLRDMGIHIGTELEMIGKALFGDPILIKVLRCTLAMRKSIAKNITVDLLCS